MPIRPLAPAARFAIVGRCRPNVFDKTGLIMVQRVPQFVLGVVAVVAILAVFTFHAPVGPYSAVHGPATALRAARSAVRLRLGVVSAALVTVTLDKPLFLAFPSVSAEQNPPFEDCLCLPHLSCVLLC